MWYFVLLGLIFLVWVAIGVRSIKKQIEEESKDQRNDWWRGPKGD